MQEGYLYVLSNEAMPGLVKIGRTERQPETRARELRTTGVPHSFKLEFSIRVSDSAVAEEQVHRLLSERGARTSGDREFFYLSIAEAIDAVRAVSAECGPTSPDFSQMHLLAEAIAATKLPSECGELSLESALATAARVAAIARRGYPPGLKRCAEIFEVNHPSGNYFRQYWQEFLSLARVEAARHLLASSNGRGVRNEVGREVAEYLWRLHSHQWLVEQDFQYATEFLVAGDRFEYEGYVELIARLPLPLEVKSRAERV